MPSYPVISGADASTYLRSLEDGDESVALQDWVKTRGSGDPIDISVTEELFAQLQSLRNKYPQVLRHRDPLGGDFEAKACPYVHRALSSLPRRVLADHEFWIWLAVSPFFSIVTWRFGAAVVAQPKNYGVGGRLENMLYRLWLRGEIGLRTGADPYELSSSGDQDLWRSHLLRQGYANARVIAHAILLLQLGNLMVNGKCVPRLVGGDEADGVRMLAKRIRRLRSNHFLEYLSAPEAEMLIAELSSDLKKAK